MSSRGVSGIRNWLRRDPVGTCWYARDLQSVRELRVPDHGSALWLAFAAPRARRYVVHSRQSGVLLLCLLCALVGRRRVVVLEFIRPEHFGIVGWIDRRAMHVLLGAADRIQVLSRFEVDRYSDRYVIEKARFALIEWPLRHDLANRGGCEPRPLSGQRRVLASGRASCDWWTLFKAAELASDWELTVVCAASDEGQVRALNTVGASIRVDVSPDIHENLMRSCDVYALCLREDGMSAGHIRLMNAFDCAAPVVASEVAALDGYVTHGVTALTVPVGDPAAMADAVATLLENPERRTQLVRAAQSAAEGRPFTGYLAQVSLLCAPGSHRPS